MGNWCVLTWDKGIWREYLNNTYEWVREHLRPEDDPDSFYLFVSNVERTIDTDLSNFKRLVLILDDPAKRYPVTKLKNAPKTRISLWYGLEHTPSPLWCRDYKILSTLHLWDAYPFAVPGRTNNSPIYDTFISGNCKRARAKKLAKLLSGSSVSCLGYDWSEYFPIAKYKPREGGLLDEALAASAECKTELVYHSPSVKTFLSLRLPNILRRGHVPLVDLDHDPNRRLLLTDKMRERCYANTPKEVIEAASCWSEFSRQDIQDEYDAQVQRAVSDMADLRGQLSK
jgi:hypothetical protein